MSYIEIIILAIALSIDACIVSFSFGISLDKNRIKNGLLLAVFTSVFQGIMPVFGYFLTNTVKNVVEPVANIIVFIVFAYLGIKFIIDSFKRDKNVKTPLCLSVACLFLVGIATSIDAFSAGLSLSLLGNRILKPALLIAFVTFINSLFGFWIGGIVKDMQTRYLEIFSGLLLIGLGVKALLF